MNLLKTLTISTILGLPLVANAEMATSLQRVAAVPLEAEITGLTMHNGDLFMNYQHPNAELGNEFAKAGVGVISNADFSKTLALPEGDDKKIVSTSAGKYQLLFNAGDNGIGVISGDTSDSPDFNSFIATSDNEGYLFTNWEERPGGMSRAKLSRSEDGTWALGEATMLDFTSVNGTWINCFGSTTPWNTPLSAEELYYDETADWNNEAAEDFAGVANLEKHLGKFPNPYDYGFLVEITDPTGTATPIKHKAMGRFSHENGFVMPDQKTVYMSDDGTDVVFFKFIADNAGDLSAGTLYAAKFTQNGAAGSDVKDVSFGIKWIELAHSNNTEVETWVAQYAGKSPADYVEGESTYISDADVETWAAGNASDNRVAFLESRKAAKAKGATAEFRKMEGVAYNGTDVFLAMTAVAKGMSDDKGDIQVAQNDCGAVFRIKVDGDYNATSMEAFVVGGPFDEAKAPNSCSPESISSPDNVLALEDGSILIGEDSGDHENNMLWLAK